MTTNHTEIIVPFRLPGGVIKRGRLLKRLHLNVDRKLFVVTAGAGYGKTTLLAQFAEEGDFSTCWVGLTPWNSEPIAFIESLVQSIRRQFDSFGVNTSVALSSMSQGGHDVRSFAKTFLDDLEANVPDYLLLILDDFHQVDQNSWIVSFISELAPYLPEHVHVVLSSRTMPEFQALPRLLVNREALLISPEDLKFTDDEARRLLQHHFEAPVLEEDAHQINDQCEGWPAALILAGYGERSGIPASQGGGFLLEYLEEELFARQGDALKSFLITTSVFPVMRGPICDSLLGVNNSDETLQELVKLNLASVEVGGEQPLYRYHSLFRQFLYNKFENDSRNSMREIGVNAGLLLEQKGLWQEAQDVYCQMEAYELAADMLVNVCDELSLQSKWPIIIQALNMLPEGCLRASTELMIRKAEAFSRQGDPQSALKSLEVVLPNLDPDVEPRYLAWALLEKAFALRGEGDLPKAESCCYEVLNILEGAEFESKPLLLARAHHNIALVKAISRDFPKALEHLNNALEVYERIEDVKMASQINIHIGTVHTELGDLSQGVAHLNEALRGFHLTGDDWGIVMTLGNLGYCYLYMAEYELAEEILTQVVSRASGLQLHLDEAYALTSLADVMRLSGRRNEALESYLRAGLIAKESKETRLIISTLEGQALIALDAREVARSRALVEEGLAFAEQDGLDWQKGVLLIVRAQIARRTGSLKESKQFLQQSLDILSDRSTPLEQCRVRLHLANTLLALGDEDKAVCELRLVSEFLSCRPDPFFLISDLLQLPELLDFASQMTERGDVFRMLSSKVEQVRARSAAQSSGYELPTDAQLEKKYPLIAAQGFGAALVSLDSEEVARSAWRSNKAKELFFYLAYQNRRVTKEEVIAALWPDIDLEKAESAFKSNLFRARKALYPECFIHENGYYKFTPCGKFQFDVLEFIRLSEIAERVPDGAGLKSSYLEESIALYKGPFLPEFYSEWCEEARDSLEYQNIESIGALAEIKASEDNHEKAAHLNQKILELDPYNEHAVGQAIIHFLEAGNLSAAANCYRRYQRVLEKELGTSPSTEIQQLYEAIASQYINT